MTNKTKESATPAVDFLRCQQWVGQLSLKDALMMEDTKEFQDFMHAFRCLEGAHRQSLSSSTNNYVNLHQQQADNDDPPAISLLQSMMAEDIVLRVLDFLDSQSLVRASQTCQRLLDLTNRNARQRSSDLVEARQLSSPLQLLRAKEQIQGIGLSPHDPYVRLPSLLLRRRIVVTDCGDPEYNGVYYCTSYSGNGFIFTKPRIPIQRVIRPVSQLLASDDVSEAPSMINGESACHHEDLPLRCILEKRFSNETILWYMSKEYLATEENETDDVRAGHVDQLFSFWAKLMVLSDASPDTSYYPSQSSVLQLSEEEGWQTLETTPTLEPPVVELLD